MTAEEQCVFALGMDGKDAVIRGIIWPPRECQCGRMASFVVNRNGKTRCLDCDSAAPKT